ncbi:MAG: hypothetical protein JNM83_04365 [Myxococcales bacterium]|nr:hypothetical protein [Myxococcales bacterium]
MGTLSSTVLILLAALANADGIGKWWPSSRFWLTALSPLSGLLGVGAVVAGLITIFEMAAYLGFVRIAPTVYLGFLGAGVLSVLLGLRFGYATLLSWFGAKLSPGVRKVCDDFQAVLIRNEHGLGYAGLATGLFSLLLNVFT